MGRDSGMGVMAESALFGHFRALRHGVPCLSRVFRLKYRPKGRYLPYQLTSAASNRPKRAQKGPFLSQLGHVVGPRGRLLVLAVPGHPWAKIARSRAIFLSFLVMTEAFWASWGGVWARLAQTWWTEVRPPDHLRMVLRPPRTSLFPRLPAA